MYNSFEDIQRAWEEVERQRLEGNFLEAYNICFNILYQRLISGANLTGADTIVIQTLADLTILLGQFQVADDLLNGLAGLYQNAENYPLAYFTILKRTLLGVELGRREVLSSAPPN